MHKMGYVAAAGIIALETMVHRLADDHRRALDLARAMAGIDGVGVELRLVQTNLVLAHLDPRHGASELVSAQLRDRGLGLMAYPDGRLRAVTHRGIDDAAVAAAVRILRDTLA
jgi:threonine aldolase